MSAGSGIVASVPETPLIACFGEGLVALVPTTAGPLESNRTFQRSLAGAEWNVALAVASAGSRAAVVSRVGDDGFGRFLLAELAQHGVDASAVEIDPAAPTGLYVKELSAEGEGPVQSAMHYYRAGSAGSRISPATLHTPAAERVLAEAALVHTTGITPALSEGARAAQDELFADRGDRLIGFDVNWRPALWQGREDEARELLGGYLAAADVAQCSAHDAEAVFGTGDPGRLRALFPGPRYLVVTRDDGATAFDGAERADAPAVPSNVVETIGAGDAFAAGFLAGVLSGLSLSGCVARANRIATRALGSTRDHVD
jgi:2-dehydro-3-deoxygluconokinase